MRSSKAPEKLLVVEVWTLGFRLIQMIDFTRRGLLLKQEEGRRKYGVFSSRFDAFKRKTTLALRVLLGSLACRKPALQRALAFAALTFFHSASLKSMKLNHLNESEP